jgi:glycine cleavage system transcriptional repressor
MAQFVMTAVGNDRPGLVGELTGCLHEAGGNILESRMVNLRGRFAVILLFEAPEGAAIRGELTEGARRIGLTLHLDEHLATRGGGGGRGAAAAGLPFKLKTYSLDQPGLVHAVSNVLREHRVNIEDLSARQDSAPFAGDPLFILEMRLTVPATVSVKKLRTDLEAACERLNADLDLEPA